MQWQVDNSKLHEDVARRPPAHGGIALPLPGEERMRVVHLTDLHVQTRPALSELVGKRLLGTANLYLLGRRSKFQLDVQQAAVTAALELKPDLVVITGDLTAQGTQDEFLAARQLLDPLLSRLPCLVLPGNHDLYCPDDVREDRMGRTFGAWMGPQGRLPYLVQHGEVAVLAIETCHPHLLSSGKLPTGELERAAALLAALPSPRPFVFLALHYPLRNRHGEPYGPATRALDNARAVEDFLRQTDRVDAVLHGHEHHGFRVELPTAAGPIPVLDPGASGYALLPKQDRTAHFNLYEVDAAGLHTVHRHRWDGHRFEPEPGGAYATGR